jgi:hypothetical protein
MADDLDAAIEAARTERKAAKDQADHWVRRVELLDVRLEALEQAAKFRPARNEPPRVKAESVNSGRGRQPGAISKPWRNVLLISAVKYPDGASEIELTDLARAEGLPNVRPKDVHSRMEDYQKHDYVHPVPKGWQVTSHAVAKFGSETTEDGSDQADDEMEAADAA